MTLVVSVALLACLVVFMGFLAIGLVAEINSLRASGVRVSSLRIGVEAPDAEVIEISTSRSLDVPPLADSLLLFVSPACSVCHQLVESLVTIARFAHRPDEDVTAICVGDAASCRGFASSFPQAPFRFFHDPGDNASRTYGVMKYPTAVRVEAFVVRAFGNPQNLEELEQIWLTEEVLRPDSESATQPLSGSM